MLTGANLPRIGDFNQHIVLDVIRRSDGVSRVDLARETGLTAQTVSNIVRRLLDQDLVSEGGRRSSRGGKPATLLRLNASAYYAVGVHIDPARTTFVLTDLSGTVVARSRRRTSFRQGPERSIRALVSAIERMVERSQVPEDRLLGVGVATPGPIDRERGLVVEPPNLPGWHVVPLRESLLAGTGLPVVIDNDATAAAIGERWAGGAARAGGFAFVYFGTGIGGGLVLGDQLYRGVSWNAGELGHMVVEPGGRACVCGNRGCLETYVSPRAMVLDAARLRGEEPPPSAPGGAAVMEHYGRLCRAAVAEEPVALRVVREAARRLGEAAVTLVNVLDVPQIVLGGTGIEHIGAHFAERIAAEVAARTIAREVREVGVELSVIGPDAGAIGAASLVLHEAYFPSLGGAAERDGSPAAGTAARVARPRAGTGGA
ncbi:ROK family transcriptional regulator [Allonocardiopsis opalescens]|uniref:Putative NBD/HSP70 family sugar kinase n=1 Tax=Allonocardiopsis opalescens TaxID=1144618 RepID=A0A2T0PZW7_9ACTN|nr:ROK family transcriptional regulator [Allonocardiopsis opalescens]PRX97078.1 putative NBD/HSP70 family sugar kinase [Allonocardiopsis opalescens]